MFSLQSVQGEQIQAQIQALQPQQKSVTEKTEKSDFSFLDLLREQKVDTSEQKPVSSVNDEQKKPESPEKVAEKPADKAQDDAVQEKLPQDQKSQVSKKEEQTEKVVAEGDVDESTMTLVASEVPQKIESQFDALFVSPQENADTLTEISVVDEKQTLPNQIGAELNNFAWMYASRAESGENAILDEEIPEDALAALLDESAFILPEIDTGDDDLVTAQKIAAENPALFLDAAENDFKFSDDEIGFDDKNAKVNAHDKTKPRLEITDLRTVKPEHEVETENAVAKTQQKNGADFAFEQKNEPAVQMTMELAGNVEQNITSSSTQSAAANGSNFQAMLTNAIQDNAPDFVKAGNIVLRDGNQGTIQLILRPETLGNVKITLSLSDKVITGQITVQSQEAYNAFKDSIDSLKAAFAQNGFEAQGFDLQFTGNQNFAQSQQEWQNPEFAIRANDTYGELVLDESVTAGADIYEGSAYGINIVA
ncbi:MAG: flagellar hook-length control protein FliK [Treponema sp.]|nr:flagellar hook-length control protein FliK [Treponema sp.]